MQEEPDLEVGAQHPQHLRDELQLVVLNPHDRTLGGGLRGGLGEAAVHLDVGVPPFAVVFGFDDDVVVKRPQGGVGEAFVVFGDLLRRQRHRLNADPLDLRVLVGVGDARPPHPGAGVGAKDGFESGDQTAGAALPGDLAVGVDRLVDGSRLATTTNSAPDSGTARLSEVTGQAFSPGAIPNIDSSIRTRRVCRVGGDDASRGARGLVGHWLQLFVGDVGGFGCCHHVPSVVAPDGAPRSSDVVVVAPSCGARDHPWYPVTR